MLDFFLLTTALVLGLVALVLAAKAVGYTSPRPTTDPGFARLFLARWLAGGYDHLNTGVRHPRKAPKGRNRGFAPTRPRLLSPQQEAFLALKKARKGERRDETAAKAAVSRPTNNNAPVQTTQTTATQTAPATVNTESLANTHNTLDHGLDRVALAARRARRAVKRAKAKAKAQQANQPQQVNQVNQTQKVEKTRSIREIAQTQKTQGANAPRKPRFSLEERYLLEEAGYVFRRTLGQAYAVLRSYPSKVVLVGDLVVLHSDFTVFQDTVKIAVCEELAVRGYKLLTCDGEKWAQMGLPVAVRRNGKIYLTKDGRVSANKTEGSIALGEWEEKMAESLLEKSGFNADGWGVDTSTAIFRMAKSASNFVFDADAVRQFNQKKKVIRGVTKLFRCMTERPEIMTAVPGASFSLYPIGGSFGGEEFFIDVTKYEVWGYPIFHPRKNPDCMTEWEVIVSGVFKTSWNDDAGMWELTPCEAPKDFDAFSKVRTFSLPGVEQLYAALPESSVVEFVPHKEFAVVEGGSGHAIIDIDVDGTEGHINPDCITANSFEQAIEMAKGALLELQAINPAWKENAIVQTGGGIRVYGPVMSPMDLMDEEKEVIERVCDPFYTESLYRSNRWSFRCTPKIVNDDFRAETMEIIETAPAKQSFVEKLKNFFTKTFEAGLSAFRNTVSYSYDFAPTGYAEKNFCEKVYDGDFPSGWGYSLSVNRIENFLTFSTHQLLQCYENAKANKLWFWYCEGIGPIDPMIYGQLLADRQIVVVDGFEKSDIEFELNELDKKYEPLDGFIGFYLTDPDNFTVLPKEKIDEIIWNTAMLLVYPDFSKQEKIQVKNKKTWFSLGEVFTNENTSDFVDKYLVHEEDTDEVLRRLIAGEKFITCNPSQWKSLGYSWVNMPGQFKAFLNKEGLYLSHVQRIAIQGKKKLSFYIETTEGWYEILYKTGKGWVYGSSAPLTGNKVTYFGNKNKEEKVPDHLSLSSGDFAKSPEDNRKEVQMVETQRAALIDAARKVCRRQKDGTISMKYKGSKFVALFNEIVGSEEVRPIVPGFEATPNDNMQGLALPMVAYEGHVGVTNGTFPAFKVEDGQFVPGHYSRAGFAWKGVANFGIYGGETENEHARHPSILRIQYPTQFEQGKDIRIIFCDFANPGIVARLFEVGAVRLPKNGTQAEMEKFIKGLISGLGTKIDPAIDGTIWVSTIGVPFAPKMPKGQTQSTYQYRGTCVFPREVGDAVATNNASYASLWEEVCAELASQVDKSKAGWVAALQASTNPVIVGWREGIADLPSYLMMDVLSIEQVAQIICGDLAIKENVAIHESYFKQSKHYGAYLKGLVATQPWLAPGVVLMDINAVKDISKKPLKKELKANNGVVEAQAGHKYVIGMMQDYSKGGIRVGSQPNTYVRSHKDGVLTVEESVERFVDFVENTVLTELGKGLQVQEVLDQLKKSMNFTNSGDGDMEGQFLVEQIVDAASGFVPAFWNHEAGRRVIRNTIKTLMNRYSFGFMTKAMKRIGTFVSVKSYITDLNLLPAAYQNGDSDDLSLFVEFAGGDDKSALGKLPITVVLFKNASFWKALGKDHTLGGILRYPVSNKDMFSGVWIVSPEAIVRDADIARLCGFEGFSTTLVENYLRGLAEGYYANSVTIKYLLCGDSDGDTAGTIPMDVNFTVDASSRTLSATVNNGDALFFWAITETRDLVQRKFAELEGFTHLQGKRKINPAAVEHVLGESNIAVGNCALWQQAVKGILDTYDKGLFRAETRLRHRNSRLYGKEDQAWESFTPAQAMDAWTWYVERILIPSYRILPCSLELAIMSQKKDLFEAFKAVTAMLVSNEFVVEYGPADARRTMVLWDIKGSAPAIFTEKIFSNLHEMVEKAEWAMLMGSLTQAVMKHLGIGVCQEDGSVVEVTWVAATRTSAMAEKENPETLLANQTDAAWGILDSDGLSWTNSYWVGYLRPHFERIRGKVEAMLHSEATFSKDKQLNLSWNRSYSRGSFNRYNLPNYTTDSNGVIVEDKEAFFEQVRAWYTSKITSRLFGMNLHGWTRFSTSRDESKFKKEDREQSAPHYANPKIGAMSLMIVWAYFQKVASANPSIFSNESEFKKFFLKLDDMCEDNYNTKLFLNWIVEVLWDADTCSEYKEHIFAFAKKHKLPSHANPQKQAWIIYCATLQGDVRVCEYLWAVDKAKQFLGASPSFDEVRPMFAYFGSYNFISFNDEGKVVVASEKYKYFVSIWKEAQRRHGKVLATEYRKSVKDDVGAIVSGWGEKEYASLFALAHQETFQAHANLCRKYEEAHFAKISNELTGQWAATYKANFLTEYARELVFRLDTPTTIAGFLRADRFIFEVVSTEMEAKRICFESTEFQFSVVDLGIKQGPLTVRPVYRKTANSEVHGLELLQDNTLVGFIGADPTSRVLLYFKSDEMFVNSIVTNLNKEDTKAVYGIKQAKAGSSCYLVQAPHSAKDQQEMLNRFLGAFADEVQDAKFGIVSVKAEMKSPELLLEKTHAEVNKRLAKVNKDSNQKNSRRCDVDVAIERAFKTPVKPAMELTRDHEWLVAMMVTCAINNKQLDSEIEMLGNFEIVLGTETYRLQDGIYTVESEIEYEEETVDSMTFDQEPEVSANLDDYAHYDVYVPEEEEEVWYPGEFEATEVVKAAEEAATEAVEEIIEAEEVTEVIAEEVIEQEEPEVVIEQTPVVIKAPVAVIESDDEDKKILEQITGLISKLSPKVRKAFDKGLESGKKALEKEKVELETKKAKLQAELTVVNKELAEINTALEASNDDDGGDDDGGGNGGGTPAPADNGPAPTSAPSAPPVASASSRIFEINGERYEIPESFQGLEVLIGENKHSLHQGRSAAKLLNSARKIQIDPLGVEELWVKQYYVSPRVEDVYGLEADAFDSVQQMVMFLLWHEYFHTVIGKAPKDNKSEYARVENACNFAAANELGILKRAYSSKQGVIMVVTGGRDFTDSQYIHQSIDDALSRVETALFIHGDARGVDRIAGAYVKQKNIPVIAIPADWNKGGQAGFERNETMASYSEVCVVLPGNNGTADMKKRCQGKGLQILDYGQKPAPQKTQEVISEFRGENFFLSNFANARIEHKGVTYKSVEHFYQAMKFTDPNIRARVAGAPNGADAKKIAKQNKEHIRKDWEKIKDDVMWYGIQCKFRGNENHKESLRNTGNAHITHLNTWGDVYWGVCSGKGEDRLGKMLMKVREETK